MGLFDTCSTKTDVVTLKLVSIRAGCIKNRAGTTDTQTMNDWRSQAKCVGQTDLFFTPGTRHQAMSGRDRRRIQTALEICSGCDVREQCLDFALEHNEYGIWGGTTQDEREMITRKPVYMEERPPVQRSPWRILESRISMNGAEIDLRMRDLSEFDGEDYSVEYAVFEDNVRIFLADNEPDAWMFLHSVEIS